MNRTGFCILKQCEGTKPLSPSGQPLPTCKFWMDCSCQCHAELTEMFQLGGRERALVNVSEYVPKPSGFWMPDAEFLASLRTPGDVGRLPSPADVERGLEGPSRPAERRFMPTPTGIRARGQLEDDVKKVCDRFDMGSGPIALPLSFIANQIHPDAPPSVGAIREVLLRWALCGFATMGSKPLAFTGYTDEGRKEGLDVMKYKYDQKRRLNKSKAERGYR